MFVSRLAPGASSAPVARKATAAPVPCRGARAIVRVAGVAAPAVTTAPAPAITLAPEAMEQLKKLRAEHKTQEQLLLRVGVKQGGCSGMSYVMDFEGQDKVTADDHVMSYEEGGGFQLVVDPKSLLYLFGMRLGFSNALIGGGFQFQNPNATDSCGCGKSFGV